MKKTEEDAAVIKDAKVKLGKKIRELREQTRKIKSAALANEIGLPRSNMKYIEDGVNAPSPEKYEALIRALQPNPEDHKELDRIYSVIRGAPPPDVCKIIMENDWLFDSLRLASAKQLTEEQIKEVRTLLATFNTKGETENG